MGNAAMQAKVTLSRATLQPADSQDLSDILVFGTSGSIGGGGSRNENRTKSGEFRQYANGVTRLIAGTAMSRTHSLAARALTPDQVDDLHSLVGKVCLFRDTYGRSMYCSFLVVDEVNLPGSGDGFAPYYTDVALALTEVAYAATV